MKQPGTDYSTRIPKKAHAKKHCDLCKKHGDTYLTHNTCDYQRFKKDGTEKSNFRTAKKGGKKPSSTKQSFAQLSKKMDKLAKAIKKQDAKRGNTSVAIVIPTQDWEMGQVAYGEKVIINFGETCKKTNFTSPSPIKATTKVVTCDRNNLCLMSVSNDDDVTMTSSAQNKEVQVNYSTRVNKNPPKGKATAAVAVVRGTSKHGYHHHSSNNHYQRDLV